MMFSSTGLATVFSPCHSKGGKATPSFLFLFFLRKNVSRVHTSIFSLQILDDKVHTLIPLIFICIL